MFKHKITQGLLVAFGAYLFVWLGMTSPHRRLCLLWYGLALLAAWNVLYLVKGATAYLTLGGLVVLLAWRSPGRRGTTYGIVGLAALFTALASIPGTFQERLTLIRQEARDWRADQAADAVSSTGLRLEFYRHTLAVIAENPLVGVGTGGFAAAYAGQIAGSRRVSTRNPHNEFLHIGAQLGMIGVLALIAMLWVQWRSARNLDSRTERALTHALVLMLVTGSLVNSLLLDHAEGLFYAWLSGML